MTSRIERSNLISINSRLEGSGLDVPLRTYELRRFAQREINQYHSRETLKRVSVYLGLALFCTAFWGGLLWLATR